MDNIQELEKLVEQGDSKAMVTLAGKYYQGEIVTKNLEKVKELLERAVELNNSKAMVNLGFMYQSGEGVPKDCEKAKELYEKAIELNNSDAMFVLANMYYNGDGVPKDFKKTKELYEKAIELKNPYAMFNLAVMYCNGEGVSKNYVKTIELYEQAIENGLDEENKKEALRRIERINGIIEKENINNLNLQISKLEKLVEQNKPNAMVELAKFYYEGKGVEKDYQKAKELLEQATELKNPEAFERLAFMYGQGFFGDDKKDNSLNAINLLERANEIYEELYQKTKNDKYLGLKRIIDEKITCFKLAINVFYLDIDEEEKPKKNNQNPKLEKLKELISKIEKKYVARNTTIRMLANNIYHGRMAMEQIEDEKTVRDNISTILLVSSTGGGKTAIVSDIAKQFDIPWTKASLSAGYTPAGYKGLDLQDIFLDLIAKAGNDIKKAERGIVILDEFDKIRINEDTLNKEFIQALQKELLTYLEGTEIKLQTNIGVISFNTSKITFILSGAFQDITEYDMDYTEEELNESISKGYEPELIGRINIFHYMPKYTKDDYIKILNDSEISPLRNFIISCSLYGKKVITSPYSPFIESVAIEAVKLDKGVRGLNNIFANILSWHLNDLIYGDSDIVLLDSYENLKRKKNRGK